MQASTMIRRAFCTGWNMLVLLAVHGFAQAAEGRGALLYTPQERALLEVLDESASQPVAERLAALGALADSPGFTSPAARALVWLEQCHLAGLSDVDATPYSRALTAHAAAHPGDSFIALVQRDCQLRTQQRHDVDTRTLLYRDSTGIAFPTVRYRLASNYAKDALSMGFVDDALSAVEEALRIAQANDDGPYHRDSLMDLALVRVEMGQHEQALADSAAALEISKGHQRVDLLLNRGYILRAARQWDKAAEIYTQALSKAEAVDNERQALTALLHLVTIHRELGQSARAFDLSAQTLSRARALGDDYFIGYAAQTHATALLLAGESASADALYNESFEKLEQAGEQTHLAETLVMWAMQLAERGRHAEAYQALTRSREIEQTVRKATRERDARYLNALLDASQKDLAIERLRRENDIAQLQIEKRRLEAVTRGVALGAVSLSALILLGSYLRLRRSSSRLAEANARLDHENAHDNLTGIYNRMHFIRQFEAMKGRGAGRAVLLLLDLDGFKGINDSLGHAGGDDVLRETARRLAAAMRDRDLAARWGGEEFILLAALSGPDPAPANIATRLLEAFRSQPILAGGQQLTVTASIGYAEIELRPDTHLDVELERVDVALYQAKREGRNRAVAAD